MKPYAKPKEGYKACKCRHCYTDPGMRRCQRKAVRANVSREISAELSEVFAPSCCDYATCSYHDDAGMYDDGDCYDNFWMDDYIDDDEDYEVTLDDLYLADEEKKWT